MNKILNPKTGNMIDDYTGLTFNNWTIIGLSEENTFYKTKWTCKCACGKVADRYISAIKEGRSKSCGCANDRTPDLIGKRFERLVVIGMKRVTHPRTKIFWLCRCDCGNEVYVETVNLVHNSTKSCGCLRRDHMTELSYRHGHGRERIYKNFLNMHQRCENPNCKQYRIYGERGVYVCDEWFDFQNFYNWAIENGYEKGLTLDRIDVNGPYAPWNCRWATAFQQGNNRRNTIYITHYGVSKTISEWSIELNISRSTLYQRYKKGLPAEKILEK